MHVVLGIRRKPVVEKWLVGEVPSQAGIEGSTPRLKEHRYAERLVERTLKVKLLGRRLQLQDGGVCGGQQVVTAGRFERRSALTRRVGQGSEGLRRIRGR